MKEVFRPTGAELTGSSPSSTLGERGNIFMDGGKSAEIPQGNKEVVTLKTPSEPLSHPSQPQERRGHFQSKKEVSPEELNQAIAGYAREQGVGSQAVPYETRQALKTMLEYGIPRTRGGAADTETFDPTMYEGFDPGRYRDAYLKNSAQLIKDAIDEERMTDLHFVGRQIERIENAVSEGKVNLEEARDILSGLNKWHDQIAIRSRIEEESGMVRYHGRAEIESIKSNPKKREELFEQIFIGVDANPGVEFQQALSLEQRGNFDIFMKAVSNAKITKDGKDVTDPVKIAKEREKLTREFSGRYEIRRILHDANWSVSEGGGDIQRFAGEMATFKAEYVDLIFSDPLVETALHMFEQAFQQIKAKNNGMLPYEELAWDYKKKSSNLEERVWDLMREAIEKGVIVNPNGQPIEEWKLRRAIILARGFGVASLRFPELAAEARLPEETPLASAETKAGRLASIYGEAIARYLDPLEHIIEKFSAGGPDRALLYFLLTGEKRQFGSKEELDQALKMKSKFDAKNKRMIDIINLFRIGGPFSVTSWRSFLMLKGMDEKKLKRMGLGVRENRLEGDVDDFLIGKISQMPEFSGKSEKEKSDALEDFKKGKRTMAIDGETYSHKELLQKKRVEIWRDALETNPLRVMWMWESKEHGKRVEFFKKVLTENNFNIPEAGILPLLERTEQDLMVLQEKIVTSNRPIHGKEPDKKEEDAFQFDLINEEIKEIKGISYSITVEERRKIAKAYVEKIRSEAREDDFLKNLTTTARGDKSPFPFLIGMEDIPFSDFDFINIGGRGMARRINDYAGAVNATNELTNLIIAVPTTHEIGPLIEALNKIKQAVASYDRGVAMEVIEMIEEGIISVYDKGLLAKLPLGIGTGVGLLTDTSFAQKTYGRAAMTWDEGDKFNFTKQLLNNGLIEKDKLEALRVRTGATWKHAAIDAVRTYGQLVLLYLAFEFAKSLASKD